MIFLANKLKKTDLQNLHICNFIKDCENCPFPSQSLGCVNTVWFALVCFKVYVKVTDNMNNTLIYSHNMKYDSEISIVNEM